MRMEHTRTIATSGMSQYQQPSQNAGQKQPAFNLDDLLDLRPPGERGVSQQSTAPPPSYPPPPVNDDPYGFASLPPQQSGYQQHASPPQQQQQQQQQQQYQPAQQPQQSYQQQQQMPPQAPAATPYTYNGYPNYHPDSVPSSYGASQQPPPPQQQQANSATPPPSAPVGPYYGGATPYGVQPGTTNPQSQPPHTSVPAAAPQHTSPYPQQAQQPYPQQAQQPYAYGQLTQQHQAVGGATQGPTGSYYGYPPQQPQQHGGGTLGYPSGPALYGMGQQQNPSPIPTAVVAPAPGTPSSANDDEADRIQLEKITRLRKELEREQERERQKREENETWPCGECTFRNKLSANACDMCGKGRPGAAQGVALAPPARQSPQPQATPPASQVPPGARWQCSVCGTANEPHLANCATCNGFRANGTPLPPIAGTSPNACMPTGVVRNNAVAAQAAPPQTWECNVCTLVNPASAAVCTACESGQRPRHLSAPLEGRVSPQPGNRPPPPSSHPQQQVPTAWSCGTCTFENPFADVSCAMCGAARPPLPGAPTPAPGPANHHHAHGPYVQGMYPGQHAQHGARHHHGAPPAPGQAPPSTSNASAPADEDAIQWQADHVVSNCNKCNVAFGLMRRRHHCRGCGFVFCHDCCCDKLPLKPGGPPEKLCKDCYKAKFK